jgi:hypothetical protein
MILNVGHALNVDKLALALLFCALGDNATPPTINDTKLANEIVRRTVTSRTPSGIQMFIETFFPRSSCAFVIKELGLIGGEATEEKDSGTPYHRNLYTFDNSDGDYDVTVKITLSPSEA